MNIELLNAIIAACTLIFVVILSQILIYNSKNRQVLDEEKYNFQRVYVNSIRFLFQLLLNQLRFWKKILIGLLRMDVIMLFSSMHFCSYGRNGMSFLKYPIIMIRN